MKASRIFPDHFRMQHGVLRFHSPEITTPSIESDSRPKHSLGNPSIEPDLWNNLLLALLLGLL